MPDARNAAILLAITLIISLMLCVKWGYRSPFPPQHFPVPLREDPSFKVGCELCSWCSLVSH